MNKQIQKLYKIGQKEKRIILGLMSGTSLDGLDLALCQISGTGLSTQIKLLEFETISYERDFKKEVREILSKTMISTEKLCLLNKQIGFTHAEMVNVCLNKWGKSSEEIDLIASHGQTIFHAPESMHQNANIGNATLQIGDGDHIAVYTGIITISDFRQKQIAAGGEGAPLATYGDYLLFGRRNKNFVLLNIGGIANLSLIPSNKNFDEIQCTDTGPGNILMDKWIINHYKNISYDKDGAIARKGKINSELLNVFLEHPFFQIKYPKTTGPEIFNEQFIQNAINECKEKNISVEDVLATLNELTAETISKAISIIGSSFSDIEIFISGGGVHNKFLIDKIIKKLSEHRVASIEETGVNPDAKEAMLFALLANELIAGDIEIFGKGSKKMPAVSLGKISLPK